MTDKTLSLYEFQQRLKQGVEGLFPFPIWVVAEISELSERQHCYLELVEREETSDKIVAKTRALIWAYTYNILKPYFETTTGYQFSAGLKILINVEVQFSELYGFSLSVKDIDPNYTLGDLQHRRQEILNRLKKEGIFDMNKSLEFPDLPKVVAVISSDKAAGYQDFMQQLHNNGQGYQFYTYLFPAIMQGEQSATAIMQALERIYGCEEVFDAVVIIRGGGAVSDLSCFDDYELAAHIAQFPLPILTGIGHDKDKSIADEVAHRSLKTPTAVADFLLESFQTCEAELWEQFDNFSKVVKKHLTGQRQRLVYSGSLLLHSLPASLREKRQTLTMKGQDFKLLTMKKIASAQKLQLELQYHLRQAVEKQRSKNIAYISYLRQKISHRVQHFITAKKEDIVHQEKIVSLLAPDKLLERGYSITTHNGKIVKDGASLFAGNELVTQLAKGEVKSVVK